MIVVEEILTFEKLFFSGKSCNVFNQFSIGMKIDKILKPHTCQQTENCQEKPTTENDKS